jgi:hypothetical protein
MMCVRMGSWVGVPHVVVALTVTLLYIPAYNSNVPTLSNTLRLPLAFLLFGLTRVFADVSDYQFLELLSVFGDAGTVRAIGSWSVRVSLGLLALLSLSSSVLWIARRFFEATGRVIDDVDDDFRSLPWRWWRSAFLHAVTFLSIAVLLVEVRTSLDDTFILKHMYSLFSAVSFLVSVSPLAVAMFYQGMQCLASSAGLRVGFHSWWIMRFFAVGVYTLGLRFCFVTIDTKAAHLAGVIVSVVAIIFIIGSGWQLPEDRNPVHTRSEFRSLMNRIDFTEQPNTILGHPLSKTMAMLMAAGFMVAGPLGAGKLLVFVGILGIYAYVLWVMARYITTNVIFLAFIVTGLGIVTIVLSMSFQTHFDTLATLVASILPASVKSSLAADVALERRVAGSVFRMLLHVLYPQATGV